MTNRQLQKILNEFPDNMEITLNIDGKECEINKLIINQYRNYVSIIDGSFESKLSIDINQSICNHDEVEVIGDYEPDYCGGTNYYTKIVCKHCGRTLKSNSIW